MILKNRDMKKTILKISTLCSALVIIIWAVTIEASFARTNLNYARLEQDTVLHKEMKKDSTGMKIKSTGPTRPPKPGPTGPSGK